MAVLTSAQILDLIGTTQKELGPMKWTDISTDLQEFHALPNFLNKEKVSFQGGVGIVRNLVIKNSGSAKHTGLYETDQVNTRDVTAKLEIPWRHTTVSYAYDRIEIAMNSGPEQIVDLTKVRRNDAMISLAELMEDTFWDEELPNDGVTPFGLSYWLTRYSSTNTTPGFYGQNHPNFSSGPGGLDTSLDKYKRFRNYTGQYTYVTKDDLVAKMRDAYRLIGFKPPVPSPNYNRGSDRYVIYTDLATVNALEKIGESQNENLGRDLHAFADGITFRGCPIRWVPRLDQSDVLGGNPVFFINWSVFYPVFLQGEYMREEKPAVAPGQHTVYRVFIDTTWNTLCTDRRRLAVLSKTNSAGS